MAQSRVKTWSAAEILTAADLNAEFDNIIDNALSLISPLTGNLDFAGNQALTMVIESGTSNPTTTLTEGRRFYRSDINQNIFHDGTDFTGVSPTVRFLTNRSGATRSVGDVVIIDSDNATSYVTTTSEGSTALPCIVLESTTNLSVGLVLLAGYVTSMAVTGATSIGNYLRTSTTAGSAISGSTFISGVFAIALTSTAGSGTVEAICFGPNTVTSIDTTINTFNILKNGGQEFWSAGTAVAADGWTLAGSNATVARNTGTIDSGTYSAAITRVGTDLTYGQNISTLSPNFSLNYFDSRAITFSARVSASVASTTRLSVNDGVGTAESSFHTGGGSFETLSVTKTIDASATELTCRIEIITSDTTSYFDSVIMVQGSNAPAFAPNPTDDFTPSIDPQGTPNANQLYKTNIVKAWIRFDGTGTIAIDDSFNVSGIVDDGGSGKYTITWDRDFTDANYAVAATGGDMAGSSAKIVFVVTQVAGSVSVETKTVSGTAADANALHITATGNQ